MVPLRLDCSLEVLSLEDLSEKVSLFAYYYEISDFSQTIVLLWEDPEFQIIRRLSWCYHIKIISLRLYFILLNV